MLFACIGASVFFSSSVFHVRIQATYRLFFSKLDAAAATAAALRVLRSFVRRNPNSGYAQVAPHILEPTASPSSFQNPRPFFGLNLL